MSFRVLTFDGKVIEELKSIIDTIPNDFSKF